MEIIETVHGQHGGHVTRGSSAVGIARCLGALTGIARVHVAGPACTNVQGCTGFFKDCMEDKCSGGEARGGLLTGERTFGGLSTISLTHFYLVSWAEANNVLCHMFCFRAKEGTGGGLESGKCSRTMW